MANRDIMYRTLWGTGVSTPSLAVPAEGKTIVVTSTVESSSGTLRQALLESQALIAD